MGRFLSSRKSNVNDEPPPSMTLSSDSSIDRITEFQEQEPKVVTLTFHRSSTDQRLGVKLAKLANQEVSEDEDFLLNQSSITATISGSGKSRNPEDVYVAALDERHDSLLNPRRLPIQNGDLVVSFNDRLCRSMELETLQTIMSQSTGVITICLLKSNSSDSDETDADQNMIVHQAVFVQPKQHTCLPMDVEFYSQLVTNQRFLTLGNLHPNVWLSRSCLEVGQIVLAMNGASSYNLEEDDARFFLQTKCELEPRVTITTLGFSNLTKLFDITATTNKSKKTEIPLVGKENELSESAPRQFSNIWSITAQKETEEEKRQREERKLDSKYIQEAGLQIREMLREAKKDRSIDFAGKVPMFTSCRKLFVAMKHRIDACARERGTGEVYFQLAVSLSKASLVPYARILKFSLTASAPTKSILNINKIMVSPSSSSPSSFPRGTERFFGHDDSKTAENETTLCHIFNTAKFCVDTIEQMEERVQNTINESYTSKVDLSPHQETFDEIAAKAMEFLVSLLSNQVRASAFVEMTKLPWKRWDQVEDTNDYVYSICHHVESYISNAEDLLSPVYFCTLCDKLAMNIIETFHTIMLSKCNQTTTTGKQQLLLDVLTLKSFFLGKLVEGRKKGALVSSWSIYEKMVSEKFQKMEGLLRVASVSEADLKDFMNDVI